MRHPCNDSTDPTLDQSYCLRLLVVIVPLVTTLIQSECFPVHILLMALAFSTLCFRIFFRTVCADPVQTAWNSRALVKDFSQVRLNRLFSTQDAILLDKQQMMIISLLPSASSDAGTMPAGDNIKRPSSRGLPMYVVHFHRALALLELRTFGFPSYIPLRACVRWCCCARYFLLENMRSCHARYQ
jgi:hypothetical protein